METEIASAGNKNLLLVAYGQRVVLRSLLLGILLGIAILLVIVAAVPLHLSGTLPWATIDVVVSILLPVLTVWFYLGLNSLATGLGIRKSRIQTAYFVYGFPFVLLLLAFLVRLADGSGSGLALFLVETAGVVLGLLTPVTLVLLVIFNIRAVRLLRAAGVKARFLGVEDSEVIRAGAVRT